MKYSYLLFAAALSLAACGNQEKAQQEAPEAPAETEEMGEKEVSADSILVICNEQVIPYDSAQALMMNTESIEQITVYETGEQFEALQKKYNAEDKSSILVLTLKK